MICNSKSLNILIIQLTLPTAFDKAGILMLDSIREIFDILDIEFESIGLDLIQFKTFEGFDQAINDGKCPVVDVLTEYYSDKKDGSHVMVATGIKIIDNVKCIQLKSSFADNPNEQGNVHILHLYYRGLISLTRICDQC